MFWIICIVVYCHVFSRHSPPCIHGIPMSYPWSPSDGTKPQEVQRSLQPGLLIVQELTEWKQQETILAADPSERQRGGRKAWEMLKNNPQKLQKIKQNPLVDHHFHICSLRFYVNQHYSYCYVMSFRDAGKKMSGKHISGSPWFTPSLQTETNIRIYTFEIFWVWTISFAQYVQGFWTCLPGTYRVLTFTASWSQHLDYTGAYLWHFVAFATMSRVSFRIHFRWFRVY